MVTDETSIIFLPFQPELDISCFSEAEEESGTILRESFQASVAGVRLGSSHNNVIGFNKKTMEQLSLVHDSLVNVVCTESGISHLANVVDSSVSVTRVILSPVLAWNLQADKMESCTVTITPISSSEKPRVAREVVLARVSYVHFFFHGNHEKKSIIHFVVFFVEQMPIFEWN